MSKKKSAKPNVMILPCMGDGVIPVQVIYENKQSMVYVCGIHASEVYTDLEEEQATADPVLAQAAIDAIEELCKEWKLNEYGVINQYRLDKDCVHRRALVATAQATAA